MSFMKKGAREAGRKTMKSINDRISEYSKNFELYGEVAYKLASIYDNITDENLDKALTSLEYEHLTKDPMARFLILGQVKYNYDERNNKGEHKELSGRED